MWCCSIDDGEGLWYTREYTEQMWLDSLRGLAERYSGEPFVVGYDLRNEPRAVPREGGRLRGYVSPTWGTGHEDRDWALAAFTAAQAVRSRDPGALIVVEGLDFATDLRDLRRSDVPAAALLHRRAETAGHIVYEVHDYTWYHFELFQSWCLHWLCIGWVLLIIWLFLPIAGRQVVAPQRPKSLPAEELTDTLRPARQSGGKLCLLLVCLMTIWPASWWLASYSNFQARVTDRWGFLLDNDEAPVWLGEFGTNGPTVTDIWSFEVGEVAWWNHITRYIRDREIDYAYWALNGVKQGGEDETFGLLRPDYVTLRMPWLLDSLP